MATGSFDASAGIWKRWDESQLVARSSPNRDRNGDGEDEEEDEDDWRFAVVLDGHESEIKSVAWSPSGQYLATCSRDKSVWVWEELDDDHDTFETIAVLQEHDGDVKCVVWHPEEELLASASYDDTIRLYMEDIDDWLCVAVLRGHSSTVWAVDFEGTQHPPFSPSEALHTARQAYLDTLKRAGPRLLSCSDDRTLRIWRRVPPAQREDAPPPTGQGRIPSILRTHSAEQEWIEEAQLPQRHDRAVYSAAWSKRTGRVVSTGSDGRLVVYEERLRLTLGSNDATDDASTDPTTSQELPVEGPVTDWVVLAEIDAAHDVYEVNHVCWARRFDKGRRDEEEEVVVSTGDDGVVKVWVMDA